MYINGVRIKNKTNHTDFRSPSVANSAQPLVIGGNYSSYGAYANQTVGNCKRLFPRYSYI